MIGNLDGLETGPRLDAYCAVCKQPVQDGDGYLWIDMAAVNRADQQQAAWAEKWLKPCSGNPLGAILPLSAFAGQPEDVPWRMHHRGCDPDLDAMAYHIEVERIRTYPQILDWTAHLMEKEWLRFTNWDSLIRAAAQGTGPLRPADCRRDVDSKPRPR